MEDTMDANKSLRELFSPITIDPPSCIVLPEITATHFELKPKIIQILPKFHGLESEDPYMHIKDFKEICSTFKLQNFSDESVQLRLFSFSLKDKAKAWLNSLPSRSVHSWEILVRKFLSKFFPMSKTNELRRKISDFTQKEDEQFYESWERFKDLLLKCPHHNFETWRLVQCFYNGMTQENRNMLESMNGGAFLSLKGDAAYTFLEELSENSQQWNFTSRQSNHDSTSKKGLYKVRDEEDISARIDSLSQQVEAMTLAKNQCDVCSICASPMHSFQSCPTLILYSQGNSEYVNGFNTHKRPFDNAFSDSYNSSGRNHPNQFFYKQSTPNQDIMNQNQFSEKSSWEDKINEFMKTTSQSIEENMKTLMQK